MFICSHQAKPQIMRSTCVQEILVKQNFNLQTAINSLVSDSFFSSWLEMMPVRGDVLSRVISGTWLLLRAQQPHTPAAQTFWLKGGWSQMALFGYWMSQVCTMYKIKCDSCKAATTTKTSLKLNPASSYLRLIVLVTKSLA